MKAVVTQFMPDPGDQEQACGKTEAETDNVDQGVGKVLF